ncbi:hypothetical protein B0H14DRAFT_3604113 [Mycena olivaceomarginata]|nr:hypothetical protein B0H14DRAFT_3604113 [Mycena olivaceomarginata]
MGSQLARAASGQELSGGLALKTTREKAEVTDRERESIAGIEQRSICPQRYISSLLLAAIGIAVRRIGAAPSSTPHFGDWSGLRFARQSATPLLNAFSAASVSCSIPAVAVAVVSLLKSFVDPVVLSGRYRRFVDPAVERILLQTVPWDARKKGGDVLQDCLRELWDKAVSIGFGYGEKIAARAKEEGFEEGKMAGIRDALEKWKGVTAAHAERREKDLEEERIAVSVETAVPANIVLDLEDTLPTTTCSVETQTDEPVAAAPPLDWAEDAGDLPVPMFPKSPPPAVARDFSGLRSGVSQPFSSLQPTPPAHTENSFPALNQIKIRVFAVLHRIHDQQKITRLHLLPACVLCPPSPRSTSTLHVPIGKAPPAVDWDRDPRLRDLSRALTALGWMRPS